LSAEEVAVLESLGARRELLDARERALEDRSALITAAESRIQQRIDELKKIESAIEAMLGQLDKEDEARITGLVNVYSRMRAKDAAAIFDALDEDVLVAVSRRMREPILAEIMGEMQPAAARKLTRLLAQARELPEEAKGVLPEAKPAAAAASKPAAAAPSSGPTN
jgi:flagellar motility protein MotE (MotC chaperone)